MELPSISQLHSGPISTHTSTRDGSPASLHPDEDVPMNPICGSGDSTSPTTAIVEPLLSQESRVTMEILPDTYAEAEHNVSEGVEVSEDSESAVPSSLVPTQIISPTQPITASSDVSPSHMSVADVNH